nr:hypothetical protein [Oryza sativa Japonica Group]ABF97538.1 hypothetical protein LOC_Os03g41010 [Oryza sativa Japonica Group]
MGVGVVIRDHNGDCLYACSELVPGIMMPETIEAIAIQRALSIDWEDDGQQVTQCLGRVFAVMDRELAWG